MTRLIYSLLWHLLLPFLALRLILRSRRQPDYLRHVGERLGRYAAPPPAPRLWVHAVSVGETRAAQPLIQALLAAYPQHHIVLTHMTPTGRATSAQLFAQQPRVHRVYLPYDLPWAVARFVAHFRPQLGLIMETEVWPNLFAACARGHVPLMLVNARLSERSARGYRRVAPLVRPALRALTATLAQTAEDASRLEALGAQAVTVMGNLKFDIAPPPAQRALGAEFKARIGSRPVLLAASTREGEEALLLAAFAQAPPEVLLLLVPRHPQRFDEVVRLIASHALPCQRRSENTPIAATTRVLLGDSMGEMFAYYAAAELAFIGGSLLPLGGQNLIEACAVGTPVLVGPHTFNFEQATREAIACGAARRVSDAADFMAQAVPLLQDRQARAAMAAAGLDFAQRHRGATARVMEKVAALSGRAAPR
jgi:3-deoxy-D-manno-octulosonic-acid transferase